MDKLRRLYMPKKVLLTFMLVLLMLLLLLFPNLCLQSAQHGLLLWFNKVLPSLLPFMIFINILVPLDGLNKLIAFSSPISQKLWHLPGHSFFAFIMGLIAGYPMGAKVVKTLYMEHKLTKEEAELTLCFSNNCGPLFIIGTVGTAMLSYTSLGYFLFFIHLLSAILISLLTTRNHTSCHHSSNVSHHLDITPSFSTLLNQGVMNAMDTIVCVGGYIIFFSVITTLLTKTPLATMLINFVFSSSTTRALFTGTLAGFFELSNGAHLLSTSTPFSVYILALIAAVIGFGGLCVYFQTLYVLDDSNLSTKFYLVSKFLQSILSFSLTLLFYPFYVLYTQGTFLIFSYQILLQGLILLCMCLLIGYFTFLPSQHLRHSS